MGAPRRMRIDVPQEWMLRVADLTVDRELACTGLLPGRLTEQHLRELILLRAILIGLCRVHLRRLTLQQILQVARLIASARRAARQIVRMVAAEQPVFRAIIGALEAACTWAPTCWGLPGLKLLWGNAASPQSAMVYVLLLPLNGAKSDRMMPPTIVISVSSKLAPASPAFSKSSNRNWTDWPCSWMP